jgi:hypothetical protein
MRGRATTLPAAPWFFAVAAAAIVSLAGCSTDSKTTNGGIYTGPTHFMVIADRTAFYKYGPAQTGGPDLSLKKGQPVTMVDRHYGFSRVLNADGEAGYVATDDIAPAPDQAPGPTTAMNTVKKSGDGSPSLHYHRTPPAFEQPNDAALPSSQPPADVPVPNFRY